MSEIDELPPEVGFSGLGKGWPSTGRPSSMSSPELETED
jgi:hypothetical protein